MTLLAEERPMARKVHACNACGGSIAIGERYMRQRNVDGSEAWVYKSHLLCGHIVRHLLEGCYDDEGTEWSEVQEELARYLAVLA